MDTASMRPVLLQDPHLTAASGFRASGVACGLKKGHAEGQHLPPALDLALVYSDVPCTAVALFTTNQIQAAPVLYDRALIDGQKAIQAVVINSGCANACTGTRGMKDARRTAELTGTALGIPADSVFVMSTGVIGQHLPMDKIAAGISAASEQILRFAPSSKGGHDAAHAIMTTDTRPKEAAARVQMGGKTVTVAGICKGAGMIHPNMATMLAMLVTDAAVERGVLQQTLEWVAERTFNAITVDGDTSTNDTLLLLANGSAGNVPLSDIESADYQAFLAAVLEVATHLAQSIVRDGEGASKFVTIHVSGARDTVEAKRVAKSIANSCLVKTAIYGRDANWGRVICAAGYCGVLLDPDRLSLWMENERGALHLLQNGAPFEIDEPRAAEILAGDEVTFRLDLGLGEALATVWTCDLTHAYVDINAHYRT